MHTPGPWTVCALQNGNNGIVAPSGGTIAQVCHADVKTQGANARLIAASPSMLEALKYVVAYHREHDSGEGELYGLDFVTTCIAAISKAEGREGKK